MRARGRGVSMITPYDFGRKEAKPLSTTMAIRVVEFSNGGYKIRKIFAEESKKIIKF